MAIASGNLPLVSVVSHVAATTTPIANSPKIDIGGLFYQLEEIMRPFADTAIGDAYKAFAPGFAQMIVAPSLISQYADQEVIKIEGVTKSLGEIDLGVHNKFVDSVINIFNANESRLVKWLGSTAQVFVPSVLGKLGLKL